VHGALHNAVLHVAVHVGEQSGQKRGAVLRPTLSDPETGCPNHAAIPKY